MKFCSSNTNWRTKIEDDGSGGVASKLDCRTHQGINDIGAGSEDTHAHIKKRSKHNAASATFLMTGRLIV